MSIAMIVLKNTPKGFKLIPVSEVKDGMGLQLSNGDPIAERVRQVMDFLMHEARENQIYKTTIRDLFARASKRWGEDFFNDCKVLPAVGNNPSRLLVKGQ